jgi:hypothetical protein
VKPGAKGGIAAEGAELLPDANEDVLRELVGIPTAGHPAYEAVHLRQIVLIQPLKRAHISPRGQGHVVTGFGS